YCTVDEQGQLCMVPDPARPQQRIALTDVVARARAAGLTSPLLVRFDDVLRHRVNSLCEAFNRARSEIDYEGNYTAVYPIKVNQQEHVISTLISDSPAARRGQVGLEAGSKPELLAILGKAPDGATLVCNGYKDREFIRLALMGEQLGHKVYIVLEKLTELRYVLEESAALGVKPRLGLRARLASIGKGNWQNTGGEKSKFGLSASQILSVMDTLKQAGQLDALQLLHFHLGSQIANIRDIQSGLQECARFYSALRQSGASIGVVDIGGGLGVDYEGTRSRSICSVNYTLDDYAHHVLSTFKRQCKQDDLPEPDIVSESGRALTAHHAVLLTQVVDCEPGTFEIGDVPERAPGPDAPLPLRSLWDDFQALTPGHRRAPLEIYHDATLAISDLYSMFIHGSASLADRAEGERLYRLICQYVETQLTPRNRNHREVLDELHEKLADKLFLNFSLFQSLPDVWGIEQVFPVLPLSDLHQPATRRVVIQDMTCDSDGRIDQYVDGDGIETTLPVPASQCKPGAWYGFFLVGAYQEILGDMHNLFGDTHAVNVRLTDEGGFELTDSTPGDSVEKVLRYVNVDTDALRARLQHKIGRAGLTESEGARILEAVNEGLVGYTYLED
ncbi:MAG: biosynthetic arginine decarboxylase, partial [Gammaproteobacteria bacterium]